MVQRSYGAGRRRWLTVGRRAMALLVVTLLVGACAGFLEEDFWEEDLEGPAEADVPSDQEAATRQPVDLVDTAYSSPELGDFTFVANDCPFEVDSPVEVDCGTLTVPEDRAGDSSRTVALAIAILRTPSADPAPDPVVFLNGGPGGVSLATHWFWVTAPGEWRDHPMLADRDLILVDQRGTGYSTPSLNCDDDETPSECHDRLTSDGVPLTAYSTPENAADLASLRLALGYDEWNLYGSSYGTRLAMAIVRDHPDGVRSMLLDGVYPLDVVPAYEQYFDNTLAALSELSALCEQQPACDDAFGSLDDLLAAALEAVEDNPATDLDGSDAFDLVFEALYSMDSLVDVPQVLWLFANDDVDAALELLDAEPVGVANASRVRRAVDPEADSTGKFYSVECREEHHMTDIDRIDAQVDELEAQGIPESLIIALYVAVYSPAVNVCPDWESGTAHDDERAQLVSSVPSLLLSGRFDPITPPRWGEIGAAGLSAATLIVSPSLAHSSVLEDPCIDNLVAAFLGDPSTVLDTSCVVTMMPPEVTVP